MTRQERWTACCMVVAAVCCAMVGRASAYPNLHFVRGQVHSVRVGVFLGPVRFRDDGGFALAARIEGNSDPIVAYGEWNHWRTRYHRDVLIDYTPGFAERWSFYGDWDGSWLTAPVYDSDNNAVFEFLDNPWGDAAAIIEHSIVKVDPSGNVLWRVGVESGNPLPIRRFVPFAVIGRDVLLRTPLSFPVDLASFGGPVVHAPNNGTTAALIVRVDAAGHFVWASVLQGEADVQFRGAVFSPDGSILALCITPGTMVAGADTLRSHGQDDIAMVRLSSDTGQLLGGRMIGTPSKDYAYSLNPMPDGGFVFGGMFGGTMDFGGVTQYHESTHGFVVRYSPNLTPLWVMDYPEWNPWRYHEWSWFVGPEENPPVVVDDMGYVYVRRDPAVVCLSPEGQLIWEEPIAAGRYWIYSLAASEQGRLIVTGEFDWVQGPPGPLDFGEGHVLTPGPSHDYDGIGLGSTFVVELQANTFVPTRLAEHSVRVEPAGVRLAWRLSEIDPGVTFHVERARTGDLAAGRTRSGDAWRPVAIAPGPAVEPLSYALLDTTVAAGRTYRYRVWVRSPGAEGGDALLFESDAVTVPAPAPSVRAWPNPFARAATVEVSLAHTARVRADVFDVAGRRVARLVDRRLEAGRHRIAWNPRGIDAPPGVYFVRVRAGARVEVRKIVRLRESPR